MDTITQFGDFQHGVDAGRSLLKLFVDLGFDADSVERPSDGELQSIFEFIWENHTMGRPFPSVEGFLSTIMRRSTYEAEIMEVFGTSAIIDAQEDSPIGDLPKGSGFVALGSWGGDVGDGDSWCLDLRGGRIGCVPAGMSSVAEARINAYGVFTDLRYLEAYLRRAAELRGWL